MKGFNLESGKRERSVVIVVKKITIIKTLK
jgi:hypothetical protein